MSISRAVIAATLSIPQIVLCAAQTPVATTSAPAASNSANYFTPSAPSDILQRSLDEVKTTIEDVKLDKWKRGSVRDEAGTNIDAIQRNMRGSLPSLLKDADAAPGTLSKTLPLSRNIDALYDVMVHLVEEARVSAPGDQAGELQAAIQDLQKARMMLDNQIAQAADAQEKQIAELRTTVQKQEVSLRTVTAPAPAPKCPAPPVPAKKKHTTKPSATTPATSTANSSTTPPAKP